TCARLTRRRAREAPRAPPDSPRAGPPAEIGDQCTSGLNFDTVRPRRDILSDYRAVLARIYKPDRYYHRVRQVMRLLDRPDLDRSAGTDIQARRFLGIPLRDVVLLWRLVW